MVRKRITDSCSWVIICWHVFDDVSTLTYLNWILQCRNKLMYMNYASKIKFCRPYYNIVYIWRIYIDDLSKSEGIVLYERLTWLQSSLLRMLWCGGERVNSPDSVGLQRFVLGDTLKDHWYRRKIIITKV